MGDMLHYWLVNKE